MDLRPVEEQRSPRGRPRIIKSTTVAGLGGVLWLVGVALMIGGGPSEWDQFAWAGAWLFLAGIAIFLIAKVLSYYEALRESLREPDEADCDSDDRPNGPPLITKILSDLVALEGISDDTDMTDHDSDDHPSKPSK